MRKPVYLIVALLPVILWNGASAQSPALVSIADAYVSTDGKGREGTWTIGNGRLALMIGLDGEGGYRVSALYTPQHVWPLGDQPDAVVSIADRTVPIGGTEHGWQLVDVTAGADGGSVTLSVRLENRRERLNATRMYRVSPGMPVVETWTQLSNPPDGVPLELRNLNAWQLSLPGREVNWLTGLTTPDHAGGSFTLQRMNVTPGARAELGGLRRSSETAVPWFSISQDGAQFFGGLMWSGAWSLLLDGVDTGTRATLGLRDMSTSLEPGKQIETPHGFFGATSHGMPLSAVLRGFIDRLRNGRPFTPLVTYNTWFVDTTNVDQPRVFEEMEQASQLGAELFVLDAGWHQGAGASGDFVSGWGSWQWDPVRFPNGLRVLSDRAHALGMKFGLWVEPERVALATVWGPGLAIEPWLAIGEGRYDPSVPASQEMSGQICLAREDAWKWVFENLVRLIDAARPDYLKWDNNLWVNCERSGHGHGAREGNFAHVQALYKLLAALRERYPDLLIENCSGGGNRLDFGMLRYADAHWMDDRSSPAVRVRHNAEGLSTLFPPASLLSFVMSSPDEQMPVPDMPLSFRSRMTGVLGWSFNTQGLTEGQKNEVASEIALYKGIRGVQQASHAALLTDQAASVGGPAWDAVQTVSDQGDAVILAFQNDERVESLVVRPVGLQQAAVYEIRSSDLGVTGYRTGGELMTDGLAIQRTARSAAQVFRLSIKN